MFTPKENWEFNTLGIYNYNRFGPYDLYFNNIRLHALLDPGDLIQAGVFNGRTLLATTSLLREIGSEKYYGDLIHFQVFQIHHQSLMKYNKMKLIIIWDQNLKYDNEDYFIFENFLLILELIYTIYHQVRIFR